MPATGTTYNLLLLSGTPIILALEPPAPESLSQLLAARFHVPEATIEALIDEYGESEVSRASHVAVSLAQLELRLGGCAIVGTGPEGAAVWSTEAGVQVGLVALGSDGAIVAGDLATLTVTRVQQDGAVSVVDFLQIPSGADPGTYEYLYSVTDLPAGEYTFYVGLYLAASVYAVTITI